MLLTVILLYVIINMAIVLYLRYQGDNFGWHRYLMSNKNKT
jgi:hypothetical protein